jgi:hypothetical protein
MEERVTKQSDRLTAAPQNDSAHHEPTSAQVARAFYARITKRADIRELLRRLAAR